MHDQFSVSSCRFKPNMQQFQHKNKDSVILFYTNVVLIFSSHVSSSFNCFLQAVYLFQFRMDLVFFPRLEPTGLKVLEAINQLLKWGIGTPPTGCMCNLRWRQNMQNGREEQVLGEDFLNQKKSFKSKVHIIFTS